MSLRAEIHKKLGAFSLDISLETQGGVLGLLGASGCGKSMTLKCIAGIEKPDSGYIALDGTVLFDSKRGINLAPQQRKVGYLFQNYALFPHMTVRQNILCGLKWEKRREIREQKYRDILKLLQLEELQKHRPHQLSGGQAQRTALARMLVNEPHLLLLDEPFSALDSHLREKLQMELRELLKRGNGLFGSAEQTGSLGVVTVNCARLGFLFKDDEEGLLRRLDYLLELAKTSR